MARKSIPSSLLFLLVFILIFGFFGCNKLNIKNLKANDHLSKANQHFSEQFYLKAIGEYEQALEFNPDLIKIYRYLGESYKNVYKPGDESEDNKQIGEKALEAFKKAFELEPNNKGVIYSLSDMYDKMRNFEEAEKLYLMVIRSEPSNMGNYYIASDFYHRYIVPVEDGKKEEKKGPNSPFYKALNMQLRRIELDPEDEEGYAYVAKFYDDIKPISDHDLSLKYNNKRIEIDPENTDAWLALGVNRWSKTFRLQNLLSRKERLDLAHESEKALKKANELDPSNPGPYSWLSVLYKSVLSKIDPDKADFYIQQGERYLERFTEASNRMAERRKLAEELDEDK